MKSTTLYLLLPLLLVGCVEPKPDGPPTAQDIVTRAIEVHGGDMFEHVEIEFDFRGARFRVWRDGGMFSFTRTYADSSGNIVEEMSNDGFSRTANAQHYEMDEREYLKLTEDVNSVVYFALLPYKLMDTSVVKKLLDPITIEGQPYHTVQVTFEQQDGGRDWEDVFVFWFHTERGTMDYLAYHYTVRGTSRFRKAQNIRTIEGIRFADYLNYSADSLGMDVKSAPAAFQAGELLLLSEILSENVRVTPIK